MSQAEPGGSTQIDVAIVGAGLAAELAEIVADDYRGFAVSDAGS